MGCLQILFSRSNKGGLNESVSDFGYAFNIACASAIEIKLYKLVFVIGSLEKTLDDFTVWPFQRLSSDLLKRCMLNGSLGDRCLGHCVLSFRTCGTFLNEITKVGVQLNC